MRPPRKPDHLRPQPRRINVSVYWPKALVDVGVERQRQIEEEGYNAAHDDEHDGGEIALAACCYAAPGLLFLKSNYANAIMYSDPWPWNIRYDKRSYDGNAVLSNSKLSDADRRALLVKAGALIVAEIERLDRCAVSTKQRPQGE